MAVALYYFAFLGALGIFWPFFSLYLSTVGLSPAEISRLFALVPLMGLCAPPLFGLVADALRARGLLHRLATAAAALSFAGLFVAHSRLALFLVVGCFGLFRAPLLPLTDAAALERVQRRGGSYGSLRLWGSLGFLCAVAGGGALLEKLGLTWVLVAVTALLALAALSAWAMEAPSPERHPEALSAFGALVGAGELWLFLIAAALGQAAGAAYDSCFSLHLARLGHGPRFVGAAWAIGVAAETILFTRIDRLIARVSAERLFAIALGTAALRWLLLARVHDGAAILALQPLHAITFGAFYVAGVTVMRDRGGRAAPAAAQGLYAGALGAGSMVGMAFAGRLLESGGGARLYGTASAVAAVGALFAFGYLRSRRAGGRAALQASG